MKVSFFVAKRYLWARKSRQLIQVISWISLVSIAVCTAALFIILSVFNGLEDFIGSRFNSFHSDIEITVRQGKTFALTPAQLQSLRGMDGVEYVSEVCSDMAVLTCGDRQFIAQLKGVAPDYHKMKRLDTAVYAGQFLVASGEFALAVLGAGVEQKLHCGIADYVTNSVGVYYPRRDRRFSAAQPMQGLNSGQLTPAGCFVSGTEYDENYVFTSLAFVQHLTGHEGEVTSVEVRVAPRASVGKVKARIAGLLGDEYLVKDQYQQEEEMYKVMRAEKWAIFAILSFILLIASFNMVGMMAMLVLDKKQDMGVFYAMGAEKKLIRRIFIQEGLLISAIGTFAGMLFGFVFCFLQKTFHLIRFGESGYTLNYYPVEIHGFDILCIFAVVLLITLPATALPVVRISERLYKNIRHD